MSSIFNDYEFQSTNERTSMRLLAESVHHWLSYVAHVSRADLLLESSLRFSIGEFIERKWREECLLERPHPHFPSRPVDFIWSVDSLKIIYTEDGPKVLTPEGEKDAVNEIYKSGYVMECKYVSPQTNGMRDKQRIFNDLCRLYYVLGTYPKAHTVFMMAGDTIDFVKHFQEAITRKKVSSIKNTAPVTATKIDDVKDSDIKEDQNTIEDIPLKEGNILDLDVSENEDIAKEITMAAFKDWFGFEDADANRSINTADARHHTYYEAFLKEYDPDRQNSEDNIQIKTQLLYKCPKEKNENTHTVAVWRVFRGE